MTAADGQTPPSPITTTTPAAATATTLLFALSCFFLLFHRSLSFQPSLPRLQRRLHEGARRHRGEQQQQQQRRHREGTLRATALPDFSGEWELDLKSSEKMRPMLKACGMSGLLIPLLERLGVRQSIRASGLAAATAGDDTDNDNDDRNKEYQLFVNISTSLSSSSFCLSLDEGGVLVPGPVGAPTRAVSSWGTVAEGSPRESNVADAERRALFTRRKTTIIICIYPLALAAVAISSA